MLKQTGLAALAIAAIAVAACHRNDAHGARHALLTWATVAWPESPPRSLAALSRRVASDEVSALLLQLGRALYRGASWDGAPLAAAIEELPPRKRSSPGGDDRRGSGLAPLYH